MAELYRRRFPATPQAVPLARHEVVDALTQAGLTDAVDRTGIALAVSEAVGNSVRHAYPPDRPDGPVEVTVTRSEDSVTITVSDDGMGIDNPTPAAPSAGLGLTLMRAQAHDLVIESDANGTTVQLRFITSPRLTSTSGTDVGA